MKNRHRPLLDRLRQAAPPNQLPNLGKIPPMGVLRERPAVMMVMAVPMIAVMMVLLFLPLLMGVRMLLFVGVFQMHIKFDPADVMSGLPGEVQVVFILETQTGQSLPQGLLTPPEVKQGTDPHVAANPGETIEK
jgi:hypothetical protein